MNNEASVYTVPTEDAFAAAIGIKLDECQMCNLHYSREAALRKALEVSASNFDATLALLLDQKALTRKFRARADWYLTWAILASGLLALFMYFGGDR